MADDEWKKALSKFIAPWKKRNDVVGALVCGSYVTGNPSRHSDIDVQILLDGKVKWRERGNKIVDGFLIEYFANPLPQNFKYFERDYLRDRDRTNAHMFLTGEVLFDKNGDMETLVQAAGKWEKKKFSKLDNGGVERAKYSVWDNRDNLEEVFERGSDDFYLVYYDYLRNLLEIYAQFLTYPRIKTRKALKFLSSTKERAKYRLEDFPDKRFVALFMKAVVLKDRKKMMNEYRSVAEHVLKEMGGFEIDGWKLRSDLEP
jgi:predicted nucleotidyltransferase